jgi:hypothetical protein
VTRDELLDRLRSARADFDQKLAAVPADALAVCPPGSAHSAKDVVAHVTAYDDLVVQRLVAARAGTTTEYYRDRVGWEAFNERIWTDAADMDAEEVLARAARVFASLVREVGRLTDAELESTVGATAALDPAWLEDLAPWELIVIDCCDHYPMHHGVLDAAAGRHGQ